MTFLASGMIIGGKYVLESKIGSGGMGLVWAARHVQLDARVAIKFIDPAHSTDESDVRFEREAKACAQVQSPHLVRVHDYGIEDDMPYLVMELVTGESLGERLLRCGRLGLVEMSGILSQICKGLRHAHEAGIIHRDLKPNNIFLAQVQEDEVVKILDFGIAKGSAFSAALTTVGCLVGTPRYMSPEQARRLKDLDHRSDLWSLAVVVFRCLTGRLPFNGKGVGDVLTAICTGEIPVPSQVAPDLGTEVDAFFARALARDPGERFQSAREMAAAFASIAGTAASGEMSLLESAPTTPVRVHAVLEAIDSSTSDTVLRPDTKALRAALAAVPPAAPTPLSGAPVPVAHATGARSMPAPSVPAPAPSVPAPASSVPAPVSARAEIPEARPSARTALGGHSFDAHSFDAQPKRRARHDLWAVVIAALMLVGVVTVALWKGPSLRLMKRDGTAMEPITVPLSPAVTEVPFTPPDQETLEGASPAASGATSSASAAPARPAPARSTAAAKPPARGGELKGRRRVLSADLGATPPLEDPWASPN